MYLSAKCCKMMRRGKFERNGREGGTATVLADSSKKMRWRPPANALGRPLSIAFCSPFCVALHALSYRRVR